MYMENEMGLESSLMERKKDVYDAYIRRKRSLSTGVR